MPIKEPGPDGGEEPTVRRAIVTQLKEADGKLSVDDLREQLDMSTVSSDSIDPHIQEMKTRGTIDETANGLLRLTHQ